MIRILRCVLEGNAFIMGYATALNILSKKKFIEKKKSELWRIVVRLGKLIFMKAFSL